MSNVTGTAHAEKAERYVAQLAKHWAHKFDVIEEDGVTMIPFAEGRSAVLTPADGVITINITADTTEDVEKLKEVVAKHIDRFAFREAPLTYEWGDIA